MATFDPAVDVQFPEGFCGDYKEGIAEASDFYAEKAQEVMKRIATLHERHWAHVCLVPLLARVVVAAFSVDTAPRSEGEILSLYDLALPLITRALEDVEKHGALKAKEEEHPLPDLTLRRVSR